MVAAVEMNPHASPMMLQNAALRAVYPVSPDGHELVWPSMRGDCETIRLLEQRVYMRAALQHAAWQEARADERWYEGGGQ